MCIQMLVEDSGPQSPVLNTGISKNHSSKRRHLALCSHISQENQSQWLGEDACSGFFTMEWIMWNVLQNAWVICCHPHRHILGLTQMFIEHWIHRETVFTNVIRRQESKRKRTNMLCLEEIGNSDMCLQLRQLHNIPNILHTEQTLWFLPTRPMSQAGGYTIGGIFLSTKRPCVPPFTYLHTQTHFDRKPWNKRAALRGHMHKWIGFPNSGVWWNCFSQIRGRRVNHRDCSQTAGFSQDTLRLGSHRSSPERPNTRTRPLSEPSPCQVDGRGYHDMKNACSLAPITQALIWLSHCSNQANS